MPRAKDAAICGMTITDAEGIEDACGKPATGWRWYQGHNEHEDMLDPACDWHANEGGRRIYEAEAALDQARAKNAGLNRRLTKAEAHVNTTIEDCRRQGVSIGRGLANAGYESIRADLAEREAEVYDLAASLSIAQAERDQARAVIEAVRVAVDTTMDGHHDFRGDCVCLACNLRKKIRAALNSKGDEGVGTDG